ncbi:MAG TPA: zf-HC2 domain-containing protein, partial [Polyangia bacterium]|nr:zf-HC2 domain-containing protein [Polyangia bacterium]
MTRHVSAERLSEWVSGDLKDRDAATVRAHVAACDACGAVVADLRAQGAVLRGLDRPEPPPTLWSTIEGALDEHEAEAHRRLWSWPAWLWGALAG